MFWLEVVLCHIAVNWCVCVCAWHLREEDAQCVGVVLPADVDLRLGAAALAVDLRAARQRERRLLCDQLPAHTMTREHH